MAENSRKTGRTGLAISAMALAFVLGLIARFTLDWMVAPPSPETAGAVKVVGGDRIGGDFTLVDHRGQKATDRDFRGSYMFVYFGYTFCPDVCPTDLQLMSEALDDLGPAGDKIIPIFVTIDPERDTVAVMADYVSNFHKRFVGLTGTAEQVAAAAKTYGVFYSKFVGKRDAGEDYLMNHSAFIFVMDPDGRLAAAFPAGTPGKTMARRIRSEIRDYDNAKAGG